MKTKITFLFFIALAMATPFAKAQTYIITTIAGTGPYSFSGDGGPATDATLNGPGGIELDDTGNIFFCDQSNNRVRKIDTKGIITTVAGNGQGWTTGDGGPATAAGIADPISLALDDSDNIYIAQFGDSRVRKVNTKGIISTVAGTGVMGFSGDGGPATAAQLHEPYGVGVDSLGNIYITDTGNERVRKIGKNDTINTIAGNGAMMQYYGDGGPATDAAINWPTWVWVDHHRNIYVADAPLVRKIDTNGIITTYFGNNTFGDGGDGGPATDAQCGFMEGGGAFDDSMNFYFPEFYTERVRKIYANDTVAHIAGTGVQGFAGDHGQSLNAELSFPYATATDHHGNIYLTDNGNQRIRKISPCSAPVSISPSSVTICRGVTVALTAQGSNTYSWSPGRSLKDSVGYSVAATPSVTTTYVVSGTTCYAHDTIVVTVDTTKKLPDLKITPDSATLCAGQNVTLAVSGSTGYQWNPSRGLSSSSGATVVATPTTTTTYVVTESTCLATDTAVITVNPVPGVYVYPATTTFFCAGQTITLYEGGANDFIWSPMTGLDTTNADSVNANPTITTTYSVYGTSLGCNSQPINVILTVQPIPVVSITPSLPGLCTGSFATIIGNGAASYLWGPSAGLSDTSGDTIIATPTITTTYTVTGTTSGCVSPTDTFVVAVDTMPVINIDPPSAGFCQGANTTFIASGAPSYTWSPATGLSATTGDTVVANPSVNTTYTVTGINIGCASIPDTITVTVAQAPNKPTITISPTGDSLISSAGSYNQWYFNGKALADSTRKVLVIKGHQKGWYEVTVTNPANGCGATSDSTTSIDQVSINNNRLSIYPNPASGTIIITSAINIEQVKITNVLGQTVFLSSVKYAEEKTTVDVSALPEGMYFVTVNSGNESTTRKLILSR